MSGYRQSSYDPHAYEQPGPPMRPYNWAQWLGVVFAVLGIAGYLAFAVDKLGWIDLGIDSAAPFISLPLIGAALINSRREPGTQVDSLQLRRNRKVLAVTLAACALILGAAVAIEFTGA